MFVNPISSMVSKNNMCTKKNQLLKPTANAQSQSGIVCQLLDPWQIEIYNISHYSVNIFLFILQIVLYVLYTVHE